MLGAIYHIKHSLTLYVTYQLYPHNIGVGEECGMAVSLWAECSVDWCEAQH